MVPASDSASQPSDEAGTAPGRGVVRRILSGLLSYGLVVLALWYLYSELTPDGSWGTAAALLTWPTLLAAVVLGVVNLATNWPPIVVALPGLRVREAAVTNTASAALSNTVPEGGAVATGLNYAMLRSWGFGLEDITSEVLVTGTWSQLMKYSLLALGLAGAALQGWGPAAVPWAAAGLVVLVILALGILALILRSEAFAHRLGLLGDRLVARGRRLIHGIPASDLATAVPTFRTSMVGLLRHCWIRLTIATLVSQVTAVVVLGVSCRMVGLGQDTLSWAVILTAWGLVTFASLLVPTPGGLGVAEVVLVSVLGYGLPESDQAAVLAAVALYRIATFLVPIPIGLVTYVYWHRSTAWRQPPGTRGPHPAARDPGGAAGEAPPVESSGARPAGSASG